MDVIALHTAGFENAVATLGTALTSEQASLMARYTKEVTVCYDSDEAGRRAASRAIPILRGAGLIVKILTVPGNKDPDEFMKSNGPDGPVRFKKLLESSGTDIDYSLQKLKSQYGGETESGKFEYLREAVNVLAGIDNSIERELYAGRLSGETGVDKQTILSQVKGRVKKLRSEREKQAFARQQRAMVQDDVNPEKQQHLRAANAEEAVIAYLFANPDQAEVLEESLPPEKFVTGFNQRIYKLILQKTKEVGALSLTDLSEELAEAEISSVARMLARFYEVPCGEADIKKYRELLFAEHEVLLGEKLEKADQSAIDEYLTKLRQSKM